MKRNIVIAAVTAAALIGGGTATALAVSGSGGDGASSAAPAEVRTSGDGARDDDRDDRDDRDDDRQEAARAADAKVTAAGAVDAALKKTPGTAVSAELDEDDGTTAWEVDVLAGDGTWHTVRVAPSSGEILGTRTDDEDDTAEVRAALKGTSVTAAEAAEAAAGKGTVTSVELDDDHRTGVWEVETRSSDGSEREWRVDASSGKVTADQDGDSDDADDDSDGADSDDD
ncbi:PepSY domain-containing protein [Streptomyces sp. CRN 30]|uniref:PepSY domain-containing protein n=1 Tax=Streptomyces sp. CRN 30 TaxID=3075613 RepID=UPI002A82AFB7|nr:PepSY domain-containing protein [Streptomyces sp. CRN 30]